jgi:hypothetical protein
MVSSAKSNVLSLIFLKSLITDMVFFVCLDDSVYLFVGIVRGVKSAKSAWRVDPVVA